jgi:hypothetical protein
LRVRGLKIADIATLVKVWAKIRATVKLDECSLGMGLKN